jgi:hypothetical protein
MSHMQKGNDILLLGCDWARTLAPYRCEDGALCCKCIPAALNAAIPHERKESHGLCSRHYDEAMREVEAMEVAA